MAKYKYTIVIPKSKKEQMLKIMYGGGFDGHWSTKYVQVERIWGGLYELETNYPHASEVVGWFDAPHFTVEVIEYTSQHLIPIEKQIKC